MNKLRMSRAYGRGQQSGLTLVEMLVALAIGLVVTGAMVGMMANTLSSGSRTISMSRLQQDLRSAMQLVTRDLRRANYFGESILCFGNLNCRDESSIYPDGFAGDITINSANNCIIFNIDRDHQLWTNADDPGGFRLRVSGGIGRIQMLTSTSFSGSTDYCSSSYTSGWVDVTNDEAIDVEEFLDCDEIDASDSECSGLLADGSDDPTMPAVLSYTELLDTDGVNLTNQRVRKVQLRMTANLIGNTNISKTIINRVRIRNDIITYDTVPSS